MAELIETFIMFVVTILAAPWVTPRRALPPALAIRRGVGAVARGLLLVAAQTIRGIAVQPNCTSSRTLHSRAALAVFAPLTHWCAEREDR
jgi:hypothetical protein